VDAVEDAKVGETKLGAILDAKHGAKEGTKLGIKLGVKPVSVGIFVPPSVKKFSRCITC